MRHDPRRSLHKSRVATVDPSCPPLMLNCGCPAALALSVTVCRWPPPWASLSGAAVRSQRVKREVSSCEDWTAEPRRRAGVSRGIVGGVWSGPLDLRCKPALQRLLIVQDTGSRTVGIEIALHHPLDQHG